MITLTSWVSTLTLAALGPGSAGRLWRRIHSGSLSHAAGHQGDAGIAAHSGGGASDTGNRGAGNANASPNRALRPTVLHGVLARRRYRRHGPG